MTPIDRLTAALSERLHPDNVGNDSTLVRTDDLALVLAVVEAAQTYVRWDSNGETEAERYAAILAALAAIEGSKP